MIVDRSRRDALIIFIKNPSLGKAKTRIASEVGDLQALHIYRQLLDRTQKVTSDWEGDRFLFYSDFININDSWQDTLYHKYLQKGADLGARMSHAFQQVFTAGYDRVAIIGSDCFALTASTINQAFIQLNQVDVVLGPSTDGGYYLLGMKGFYPELFLDVTWSTDRVLQQTEQIAVEKGISTGRLQELTDIDHYQDWVDQRRVTDSHNDSPNTA